MVNPLYQCFQFFTYFVAYMPYHVLTFYATMFMLAFVLILINAIRK